MVVWDTPGWGDNEHHHFLIAYALARCRVIMPCHSHRFFTVDHLRNIIEYGALGGKGTPALLLRECPNADEAGPLSNE
jgi:hypothetical protein